MAGAEDATVADFVERFFKDIQSRDCKDVTIPRHYLEKDTLPHIGNKLDAGTVERPASG